MCPGRSPLAQLLQGPASAQAQVIPQQLQLLPAAPDEAHLLHVLVQRGVHQLQVDEGLGPDLRQEPPGLPANLQRRPRTAGTGQHGRLVRTSGAGTVLPTHSPSTLLQRHRLHSTDEGTDAQGEVTWPRFTSHKSQCGNPVT